MIFFINLSRKFFAILLAEAIAALRLSPFFIAICLMTILGAEFNLPISREVFSLLALENKYSSTDSSNAGMVLGPSTKTKMY